MYKKILYTINIIVLIILKYGNLKQIRKNLNLNYIEKLLYLII